MTVVSKRRARDEKRKAQVKAKLRVEKQQSRKTFREQQEVAALDETIAAGAPAPGSNPMALDQAVPGSYSGAKTFEELPLSQYTKAALKDAGFVNLTAIQRAALPHALSGRDILGAAKTGSGKTLCFLIPVSSAAAAFVPFRIAQMTAFVPGWLPSCCGRSPDTCLAAA
jgi:ATP-dependent RNA helicase DDX10/DBP4